MSNIAIESTMTVDQLLERLINAAQTAELLDSSAFLGRAENLKPFSTGAKEGLLDVLLAMELERWPRGRATRTQARVEILDGLRFVGAHTVRALESLGCLLEGCGSRARSPAAMFNYLPKEMGRFIYLVQCCRPLLRFNALSDVRRDDLSVFIARWAVDPALKIQPLLALERAIADHRAGRPVLGAVAAERSSRIIN